MTRPGSNTHNPAPLAFRLHLVGRQLAEALDQCVAEHDITIGQAKFLRLVVHHPEGLTLAELASLAQCTRANVTQMLDRLEARGLAQRFRNTDDGRSNRAFPTPSGKRVVEKATAAVVSFEQKLIARLGPKNADTLWKLLGLLD